MITWATTTSQSLQQSHYYYFLSCFFRKENKRGRNKETKTETVKKSAAFVHGMTKTDGETLFNDGEILFKNRKLMGLWSHQTPV